MKINIISVGNKLPSWLNNGVETYLKRLKPVYKVQLINIGPHVKSNNVNISRKAESENIIKKLPPNAINILLDVKGTPLTTNSLATKLETWMQNHSQANFIIGGADGVDEKCHEIANFKWSLSGLTMPHTFVKLIVLEQLFRAHSIMTGHPYHRDN